MTDGKTTPLKDIMRKNVFTVSRNASVAQVVSTMLKEQVIGLGVLDENDKLLGIVSVDELLENKAGPLHFLARFSATDPFSLMEEYQKESKFNRALTAGELVNHDFPRLTVLDTIEDAIAVFLNQKTAFIPVMEGDKMAGVVTRLDLLSALFESQEPRANSH